MGSLERTRPVVNALRRVELLYLIHALRNLVDPKGTYTPDSSRIRTWLIVIFVYL